MRPRTKAILAVAVLAVIAMLYVFSREPSAVRHDNCPAKGIDPTEMKEGACMDEGTLNVVVNRGDLLEMETLDVRLEGMRETPAPARGERGAPADDLVTFDLAVSNPTDAPMTLDEVKTVLYSGGLHMPDAPAERSLPTSLRADPKPIRPGQTVHGTLVFRLPTEEAKSLYENGNLDFGNVGSESNDYEPESIFGAAELGVIRTEKPR
jgi:hypothetical protein